MCSKPSYNGLIVCNGGRRDIKIIMIIASI